MRWLRYGAVWFLIALPFSPSIYALVIGGPACFAYSASENPIECVALIAAFAPIAAIFGPIPDDQAQPISVLPQILVTAFVVALVLTAVSRCIEHAEGGKNEI
jgi:hypothetical protein